MDYNRNNQNGDNQWDRWNSNASHNSYYNQPTHRPYGQAFAFASLICGLLSVTVGMCGIAIPLGALGILFALLTYRKGRHMNNTSATGLILSGLGATLGILLIVFVQVISPAMLRIQLQSDAGRQQMETMYNSLLRDNLGMEFEEYLEYLGDYYNINF